MFHSALFFPIRKIIRLVTVLVLLSTALPTVVAPATAADGINRYVSPGGSNTTNCANSMTPCQTISYALTQSTDGDTLLLDVGVYMENLVIGVNIRIVQDPAKACPQSGSLKYEPCAIIDGNNAGRVINIAARTLVVSLEKVTIRNGYLSDSSGDISGAGIFNNGTLILDDVTLHDNNISASSYIYRGGAIDNQNTLTIRSSTVYNNSAYDGGGITSTGPLTVQNTEIYNNTAIRYGGGIWIPYGAPSTVENSTLWGNYAGSVGGGVSIFSDGIAANRGEEHIFNNVTISGNSASSSGGGLFSSLKITMDHSTIAENSAANSGADLILNETQTQPESGFPHSQISNTIISNPAATLPLCSISGIDTFVLSGGGNLSSDHSCDFTLPSDLTDSDPNLLALSDNGGHVRTRALSSGSPAIDHAGPYLLGADARGITPKDGDLNGSVAADIGAYEFDPSGYVPFVICLPMIMR
jgi:hypothetical protein